MAPCGHAATDQQLHSAWDCRRPLLAQGWARRENRGWGPIWGLSQDKCRVFLLSFWGPWPLRVCWLCSGRFEMGAPSPPVRVSGGSEWQPWGGATLHAGDLSRWASRGCAGPTPAGPAQPCPSLCPPIPGQVAPEREGEHPRTLAPQRAPRAGPPGPESGRSSLGGRGAGGLCWGRGALAGSTWRRPLPPRSLQGARARGSRGGPMTSATSSWRGARWTPHPLTNTHGPLRAVAPGSLSPRAISSFFSLRSPRFRNAAAVRGPQ